MMVIPAGRTVTVTTNISYSGSPMRIKVLGTLFFDGGGSKLSFPCGSIVEIMSSSASITGNNSGNSQSIKICGTSYWQVSQGPQTGYLAWPPNSTLPVELISFSGQQVGHGVEVRWTTATEMNSDRFELWRAGNGDPSTVGSVPAAGNSLVAQHYALNDGPPGTGTWLYTLVQFDLDGAADTLGTIAVHTELAEELRCFPIPATDHITISTPDFPALVEVRDVRGQVVHQGTVTTELSHLPLAHLRNGTYMVATTHADRTRSKYVLVMH